MPALQDYAKLVVFYNGTYLEQITSIEMVTNSGNQRIDLLNEGLGGFSSGSGDVTITIGFVIPIGGQEADFQQDAASKAFVSLQIGVGSGDYVGTGKLESVSISQSVNAAAEGTFTWIGELSELK
jgi:hypothetical protein